MEQILQDRIKNIQPTNQMAVLRTKKRLDSIAKPLGGLGELENIVARLGGISEDLEFGKKLTIVACADNGVVCNGISQTDSAVTAIVAGNIAKGQASVAIMSEIANADVLPIDVGMITEAEGVDVFKTMNGTRDFLKAAAMEREDAIAAILVGMDMAARAKAAGYNMIATGEMGIGNTTTASGICACMLGLDVEKVTGKGAGLSGAGILKKIEVIKAGIALHNPDPTDPIDVLSKIGGLDIACMCGMFLGGGECGIAVVCDGFISAVAALLAASLSENVKHYIFASHLSAEGGAKYILDKLGLKAIIQGEMALGEGTGAVALFPLVDMALAVCKKMPSFADIEIEEYKPL